MSIDYSTLKGVIHIGASVGQETPDSGIHFYESYGLNVLWIEAIPGVFNVLQSRIIDYPKQKAIQCLLTDKDDQDYDFYISSNNGESSSILELHKHKEVWKNVHYVEKINLKSKTLSTLIKENNIDINDYDCITLDTQGSELLILKGSLDILDKIDHINLEVANFESYKNCCTLDEVETFFIENNYKRVSLNSWNLSSEFDYFDVVYKRNV